MNTILARTYLLISGALRVLSIALVALTEWCLRKALYFTDKARRKIAEIEV